MSSGELQDSFRVLSLPVTASEAEIKRAYRKLSLRFHPDKAGKDVDPVEAANRFHRINLAYETLMDPAARALAVQKSAQHEARRERQEQYEGKRRAMADELERSEQSVAKKRQDLDRKAKERQIKIQTLKEEARKLMLEKQKELDQRKRKQESAAAKRKAAEEEQAMLNREPELDPLDKTVRIRFPSSQYSELAGTSSGTFSAPLNALTTPLANSLSVQFGSLEHLQFQLPSSAKKVKREITALASFVDFKDAWQAVITGGEMRCTDVLEDVYIGWAKYEERRDGNGSKEKVYLEPKRVEWYAERGIMRPSEVGKVPLRNSSTSQPNATSGSVKTSMNSSSSSRTTAPITYTEEYERATLQRLRDAQGSASSQVSSATAQAAI